MATATRRRIPGLGEAGGASDSPGGPARGSRRERRERRGGRRWRWLVVAIVAVVAAGAVGWTLWFSSLFGVAHVSVGGTKTLDPAVVLEAAGITTGTPLLRVDTAEVESEVAAAVPEVGSVTVSRSWPDTVTIRVTERTPLAVVTVDDRQWLVDREAVLYKAVDTLPEAVVPPGVVALDVAHPGPSDPATQAAISVVDSLAPDVRGLLALVTAPSPDSVTLALTDGRTVIWGGPDEAQRKADVLAALLTQPGSVFDVSSPEMAIVR